MNKHTHIYRAVPGAGWRCIHCPRMTVTRPPKEQSAAWVGWEAADREAAGTAAEGDRS